MKKRISIVSAAMGALSACGAVSAGPDWVEGGDDENDAGSTPGDAQVIFGSGPLESIDGVLTGPNIELGATPGDFEDMYLLTVDSFEDLSITTQPDPNKPADFDTILYLFTGPDHPMGAGFGLLANDNCIGCLGGASLLEGEVTDGSQTFELIDGLTYFLAVTGAGNIPFSAQGAPIFNFEDEEEISGPDGPGGSDPFGLWSGQGQFGEYIMPGMMGTAFVPSPSPMLLLAAAGGAMGARRRRGRALKGMRR